MIEINGIQAHTSVLLSKFNGKFEVHGPFSEDKPGENLNMITRQDIMNWAAPVRVYASDDLVAALKEEGEDYSIGRLEEDGKFMLCLQEEE